MGYITVKGTGDDHKVILWETDDRHPTPPKSNKGEVMIVNDGQEYTVGETPKIKRLLADGKLIKVDGKGEDKGEAKPKPKIASLPDGWQDFDDMTVDDIRERLKGSAKPLREKLLAHERANKKREDVLTLLVNWNS